jgi:hypothetical protein
VRIEVRRPLTGGTPGPEDPGLNSVRRVVQAGTP